MDYCSVKFEMLAIDGQSLWHLDRSAKFLLPYRRSIEVKATDCHKERSLREFGEFVGLCREGNFDLTIIAEIEVLFLI